MEAISLLHYLEVIGSMFSNLLEALAIALGNIDSVISLPSALASIMHPSIGSMVIIATAIWIVRFLLMR